MILKCRLIFCANEHGTGDACFPDIDGMDSWSIKRLFVDGNGTIGSLRRQAKKEGWGRINGEDYCPVCMENGV